MGNFFYNRKDENGHQNLSAYEKNIFSLISDRFAFISFSLMAETIPVTT